MLRNDEGDVEAIVEEKDATREQREIREINSGILAFDAEFLLHALPRISNDNAKGEYYLTDAVGIAREDGLTVGAFAIEDVMQTEGANDRAQLAELGRELNRRIVDRWMREGVTVMDPATTWIDADVVLAPDVTILPGTQLLGATVVAEDAVIGPDSTLKDCEIGPGARVVRTHGELAVIGAGANVGPFSYLRPGTQLGAGGKIGGFVETKNAVIGDGAKVPHLSYVGDAEIGEGTNIGAGTIFANYDGVRKHRTTIGRHATHRLQQHVRRPGHRRRRRRHGGRHRRTSRRPARRARRLRRAAAQPRGLGPRSAPARPRRRPRRRRWRPGTRTHRRSPDRYAGQRSPRPARAPPRRSRLGLLRGLFRREAEVADEPGEALPGRPPVEAERGVGDAPVRAVVGRQQRFRPPGQAHLGAVDEPGLPGGARRRRPGRRTCAATRRTDHPRPRRGTGRS